MCERERESERDSGRDKERERERERERTYSLIFIDVLFLCWQGSCFITRSDLIM